MVVSDAEQCPVTERFEVGNLEDERHLGRSRRRREENIKLNLNPLEAKLNSGYNFRNAGV
jgi:hypothetical protein